MKCKCGIELDYTLTHECPICGESNLQLANIRHPIIDKLEELERSIIIYPPLEIVSVVVEINLIRYQIKELISIMKESISEKGELEK